MLVACVTVQALTTATWVREAHSRFSCSRACRQPRGRHRRRRSEIENRIAIGELFRVERRPANRRAAPERCWAPTSNSRCTTYPCDPVDLRAPGERRHSQLPTPSVATMNAALPGHFARLFGASVAVADALRMRR